LLGDVVVVFIATFPHNTYIEWLIGGVIMQSKKEQREQLSEAVEVFLRSGGVIEVCEPQKGRDITWQRDWKRCDVMNRMGGVVPDGMVPFSRNERKGG
jgi:hypothetical protein